MNLANKRGKTSQWSSSNNFRQSYGRNFIELPGTLVGKMLGTRWTRRSPLPVCICQKYTLIFIARRDYRAFGIVMAGTLNYKNVFRHQIPVVHPGVCIENLWKIQTGKYCPSSVGGEWKVFLVLSHVNAWIMWTDLTFAIVEKFSGGGEAEEGSVQTG